MRGFLHDSLTQTCACLPEDTLQVRPIHAEGQIADEDLGACSVHENRQ